MGPRREAIWLVLILTVTAVASIAFSILDRRMPNDHDPYFANGSIPHLLEYQASESTADRAGILADHFVTGGPHPRLGPTVMVATLGTFGSSRLGFRLVNLPFVVLMALGTWLLGRQLGGARVGLIAAALVIGVPTVVVHSRKFVPPFHGAALGVLAWALFFLALRVGGRKGWAAAVAAGVVQGARCYTHPGNFIDVALGTGLVGLVALILAIARRGPETRMALARVSFAGLLALGLATHVLGVNPWLPEPGYSVSNYAEAKAHIVHGSVDAAGVARALRAYASDWWRMHLFPSGMILVVIGCAAALWRARRATGEERIVALPLALAVAAQSVPATMAVAKGTFTSDWQHLVPSVAVLVTWGVLGGGAALAPAARAWAAAIVANTAFVLVTPFLLAAAGPTTKEDVGWYARGLPGLFARCSTGGLWNTHHIPVREELAGNLLARRMADRGLTSMRVMDMTWRGGDAERACEVDSGEGSWVWGSDARAHAVREWAPWPFLFHDMQSPPGEWAVEGTFGDTPWRTPPRLGDPVSTWLASDSGPAIVVRLWTDVDEETRKRWRGCQPTRPTPELVADARELLEGVFVDRRVDAELWDLGSELIGLEDEVLREPLYLSTAFLLVPD